MVESKASQILLDEPLKRNTNHSRSYYMQWRVAELFSSIFSFFGLIIATADYEQGFSESRTHSNCAENPNQILRWLNVIFTLISMYFLILRHYTKYIWNSGRLLHSLDSRRNKKKTKSLYSKRILLELAILSILPYPYLKASFTISQPRNILSPDLPDSISLCYNLAEFLYILMFIRLVFLLRSLFNFTPYQDDHAKFYCGRTGTKANVRFSIRCMMKTHPFLIIYCFSFPSFFLLGIFLRVFERPFSDVTGQNFASYQNAVWNCAITMATVGYGELFPSTVFGRIVGVLCCMWGAFVFSMIVFTFQALLQLGSRQNEAFVAIKQTRAAAKVITASLNYFINKRKFGSEDKKCVELWRRLEVRLKKFKVTMKNLKKEEVGNDDESPISKLNELAHQLFTLEAKINKLLQE